MIANRMKNLRPYIPGEQPKDRDYIKLNANENPFPPSPRVIQAVCKAAESNPKKLALYTDPDSSDLRRAIAKLLNSTGGVLCKPSALPFEITADMIHIGNGSDEVLSHVFYAFFDSDRPLVTPEHSYSFYPVYSGFYGIPLNKIPLKSDWSLDKEKMISQANKTDSATIFANPNAPTSIAVSLDELRDWLERAPKDKVFVVDEAYCDFADESALCLLKDFANLAVVRTFSKSLCGAGQRLGFVVANPELINAVRTAKNSFNHFPVDYLSGIAGVAACEDSGYYIQAAKEICRVRADFIEFLWKNGWFCLDSKTNFVFCKKDGIAGIDIYKKIKESGILVRHFDTRGIEDFVRITIGTESQMEELKNAILNICG